MTHPTSPGRTAGRHLAAMLLVACCLPSPAARATGTLSGGDHVALEQRVALAIGPTHSSSWSQVRARTQTGSFAIVVPAEPLAALDWATPAWTEALELASAPRVLPPAGSSATCPDEPAGTPLHIAGDPYHHNPMTPAEVVVLTDATAVQDWATARGLTVTGAMLAGLEAMTTHRFVVARFDAPEGEALTPALRVVGPASSLQLPLVLTEAGAEDLLVTVWTLAEGRASLSGDAAQLDVSALSFDAAAGVSNYLELRRQTLRAQPAASLLEMSSPRALVDGFVSASGEHTIEDVVSAYFKRAALYQSGSIDGLACAQQASAALSSTMVVAESCPRAALGVVEGSVGCVESPSLTQIDPQQLRCGSLVDDLAVALSGQQAASATLTRHSIIVPATHTGSAHSVALVAQPEVTPWLEATSVDTSDCGGSGGAGPVTSGSGASDVSSGGGGRKSVQVPVYELDTSCGAREVGNVLYVLTVEVDESEDYPDYYTSEEDCGGDTSGSVTPVYEDGDSSYDSGDVSYDDGYVEDGYDDGCGSDSSESYDSGDDCGGDGSESYDGGDDCGGDSGGEGCSVSRGRRRRPRLSVLTMALLMLVTPLRRATRRRRNLEPKRTSRRRR